jgi:hypothetical protein
VPCVEVAQGPGEVLFVPSGWHHQVWNETGCLSLNHNWFNGSALRRVWAFLKGEAGAVRARLRHLEYTFEAEGGGWARQCEAVLRANAAMSLTEWAGLLVGKARRLGREVAQGQGQEQQQQQHQQQQQQHQQTNEHRRRQRRRDLGRVVGVLKELRDDPCLLDSLFPPHLEARVRSSLGEAELEEGEEEGEEEEVWPPPPPPPQAMLRPLVRAWLEEAIAAAEGVLAKGVQQDEEKGEDEDEEAAADHVG